jgi:hypothetical protein
MRAIAQTGLRATIAGIACLGVGACASDDDTSPASPPPLESVTGYCHATARENAPALYRCYGAVIRDEPLYRSEDRDLYAVLAATADLLAERLERRQITNAEAQLLWETAKSSARSESIRRIQPVSQPPPPPGP